jgi:hypothetical protein
MRNHRSVENGAAFSTGEDAAKEFFQKKKGLF